MQRLRETIFAKISYEKVDLNLPKTSMVEIVDRALPALSPVYPKKALNIVVGTFTATLLASLTAALVLWRALAAEQAPIWPPPTKA